MKVFLAGACGAVGRRLVPLLLAAGHDVVGTTRSPEKAAQLAAKGVGPVLLDGFDAVAVEDAVRLASPEIIINQLTDLPQTYDPATFGEAAKRNADIRKAGTANLVRAAGNAGTRRMIAATLAFVYAPGAEPHSESDPLDTEAEGTRRVTVEGAVIAERLTLQTPGLAGIVLRYGYLYGPGTWYDAPEGRPPVHVDAAAHAALLSLDADPGVYNVADDTGFVSIDRARRRLGWDPGFRLLK